MLRRDEPILLLQDLPRLAQRQNRNEGFDRAVPQLSTAMIRHALENAGRDASANQIIVASWRRTWAMIGSGVAGIWAKSVTDSMGGSSHLRNGSGVRAPASARTRCAIRGAADSQAPI